MAAACQRARDSSAGILGLIPVTVPELLRQLRGTVIPEPRRDKAHRDAWSLWRRRHQYRARQAHQRWHAYADELPDNDLQLPYQCCIAGSTLDMHGVHARIDLCDDR